MSFSARLKEERKRLKLTQKQLAAMLDITEQAQVAYEKDRLPQFAGYLEALVRLGIDVAYVITGERGETQLASEELELITAYRQAAPDVQKTVRDVLRTGMVVTMKQVNVGRDNFGDVSL